MRLRFLMVPQHIVAGFTAVRELPFGGLSLSMALGKRNQIN